MTLPPSRRDVAYAPELAVIYALRATVEATCAALAAAHHLDSLDFPASPEQVLACRLYAALARLALVADAYCDHVVELARPCERHCDDLPF